MELLLAIGKHLVSETQLEPLLRMVADYARDLIDAETMAVPLIDFGAGEYEYRAASGKNGELLLGKRLPMGAGMCGWVLANRQPLFFGEGSRLPMGNKTHWERGMESALLVPLIASGRIIGGLSGLGKNSGESFSQRDQNLLTLFANQVSVAIENAHIIAELNRHREKLEEALEQTRYEKGRAQVVIDTIAEGLIITRPDGRITSINPACQSLLGIAKDEAVGKPVERVVRFADRYGQALEHPIHRAIAYDDTVYIEAGATATADDGHIFEVEGTVSIMRDAGQLPSGLVMLMRDVTQQHKLERQIHRFATYDELTGLFNRRTFRKRMEEVLEGREHETERHALCYLDVDQFKVINDTCGHIAGDELLRQLAGLLSRNASEGDLLGRIGGDEFALLLCDCEVVRAIQRAEGLRETVEGFRYQWSGRSFRITASIGIATLEPGDNAINRMLSAADQACYAAKERGRNQVMVYTESDREMQRHTTEMQWVERLHDAMANDHFELYYQPIMALGQEPGALSRHYEILIRMRQGENYLSPGEFIPAAERYGLIRGIDRWVIRNYLRWLKANPVHAEQLFTASINLSGATLGDREMGAFIQEEIRRSKVPPHKLCFEVTETAAIADLMRAEEFIQALKAGGCRFSLDDFGTGLSSFGYLRELPIDKIKIDGSFIRSIHEQPADAAIVRAMVDIGRSLGKSTIAEFVESQEILEYIRDLGVDYGQGYHIGIPRPLIELSDLGD
jgi:Amt family ammonium transporter